jgi:hypothetical protein
MGNENLQERIKKYIDKIERIPEGQRNAELYKYGQCLRSNFGLTAGELFEVLQQLNADKCSPPIAAGELQTIAESVDASNIPLGERTGKQYTPAYHRTAPPKKDYCITAAADLVPVADYLKKEVSVFSGARNKNPIGKSTLRQFLAGVRTGGTNGKYLELLAAIRSEPDKEKRNELKADLPAVITSSAPVEHRKAAECCFNGILCLDFDGIPIDELETAKQDIAEVDYIFAVAKSASGTGLFALAAVEGTPDLKKLLAAMQKDFRYELDRSCTDVSWLRFLSFDSDIIIKDKVAAAKLTEREPENISDEFTEEHPEYVGLLKKHHLNLLAGEGGVGKSSYARWIGTNYHDKFDNLYYVGSEDSRYKSDGFQVLDYENFISGKIPFTENDFVVFENIPLQNENNNAEITKIVENIRRRMGNATGVIVHHLRKATNDDEPELLYRIRGGGAFVNAVRCAVAMIKTMNGRRYAGIVKCNFDYPKYSVRILTERYETEIICDDAPETVIGYNVIGIEKYDDSIDEIAGADRESRRLAKEECKENVRAEKSAEKIFDFIASAGSEGKRKRDVERKFIHTANCSEIVKKLIDDGRIILEKRQGKTKKGKDTKSSDFLISAEEKSPEKENRQHKTDYMEDVDDSIKKSADVLENKGKTDLSLKSENDDDSQNDDDSLETAAADREFAGNINECENDVVPFRNSVKTDTDSANYSGIKRCGICSKFPCTVGLVENSPTAKRCEDFDYDLNKF